MARRGRSEFRRGLLGTGSVSRQGQSVREYTGASSRLHAVNPVARDNPVRGFTTERHKDFKAVLKRMGGVPQQLPSLGGNPPPLRPNSVWVKRSGGVLPPLNPEFSPTPSILLRTAVEMENEKSQGERNNHVFPLTSPFSLLQPAHSASVVNPRTECPYP
jgi:hypothetical protein